jgi:3-hydroxyisobutyrate dehydrogenase
VRDAKQTRDLLWSDQAILAPGHGIGTLILSSTLSPVFLREIESRCPGGIALVDAPMSGAPHAAEAGTLTFMLGGAEKDMDRLSPLFHAMGETIHHLGPFGAGMAFKVCNNLVAAASVVACRRAYDGARALGLDPDLLRRVMAKSSGATWYGDNFDRISWAREGYGTDNTIAILEKDVGAFRDAVEALEGGAENPFDQAIIEGLQHLKPER